MAEEVGAGAIARPKFEPGDALLFDHLCLHRTGHDPSMQKGRYAIETWLMAPSSYSAMTTRVEDGFEPDDQVPLVFRVGANCSRGSGDRLQAGLRRG